MTLSFGSLFSGVGGFDIGLERAGWNCLWQVEWDKHCQQTLKYHWSDIPKMEDVRDVKGASLAPVDVITFGSPCQDLSTAGRRAGLQGARSGLFFEATRIIKEMQDATDGTFPRWTIWENVAGALSSTGGADFGAVLTEMGELGAHLSEWAILDARHFGVPHRRRRVFLISCFDSAAARRSPDKILSLRESRERNPASNGQKGKTNPALFASGIDELGGEVGHLKPIIFSHTQSMDIQASTEFSPTIRTGGQGMAICYEQEGKTITRRLTPIEVERLMGWPDNHTLHRADGKTNSDTTRFRMCGNGVVAPVATWVAQQINKVELGARP